MQTALPEKDVPLGLAGVGFAVSIFAAVSISVSQNVFTNLLLKEKRKKSDEEEKKKKKKKTRSEGEPLAHT
jgi:hypothetical protein